MDTAEFKDLKLNPLYGSWSPINGRCVKAHFYEKKDSVAEFQGWNGPKTGNLSNLKGPLGVLEESIKGILMDEEEAEAAVQLDKAIKDGVNKAEKDVLQKEESAKSYRKRKFYDMDGTVVNSRGLKKDISAEVSDMTSTSATSSSSRMIKNSFFNPFDVDSIASFINKPSKKVEEEITLRTASLRSVKVVQAMILEHEMMGDIKYEFDAFLSTLSTHVQETLAYIPFDLILEKFDCSNKDSHITHLEKCGVPYLDSHKVHKFVSKIYTRFSTVEVLEPIVIHTPDF